MLSLSHSAALANREDLDLSESQVTMEKMALMVREAPMVLTERMAESNQLHLPTSPA